MIIDAHNHPDWRGYNINKFLKNMKKYNINKTWLLSWEAPKDEYDPKIHNLISPAGENGPISFSRCLSYKKQFPDKFVLGYAPDPRRPEAVDKLKAGVEIYNVQICGEVKLRMCYDNPDALRMFKYCGQENLPVILHFDYEFPTGNTYPRPNYWYGGNIETLERVLKACPETVFLGHAPGFWAHISGDNMYDQTSLPEEKVIPGGKIPKLMRDYNNLYCDLSASSGLNAIKRDPEFAKEFFKEYQDRILYGRDYFNNKHQQFLNELGLEENIMKKIYAENALRLLS